MRPRPTPVRSPRRTRPWLERLEDRLTPAPLPVVIGADPIDPARTALIVTGTAGNDTIWVRPSGALLNVQINGVNKGNFAIPTGHIILDGQAGNDQLSVDARVTVPAYLIGGPGNDALTGG